MHMGNLRVQSALVGSYQLYNVGVNNFPQTEFGRSFVAKVIGTDNTAKYTQLQNSAHKYNKIMNRLKLGLHCAIFAARESERLLWESSFRLSG